MYITENSFAPQNEPHTAKLIFSDIWKDFHGNSPKKQRFFKVKISVSQKKLRINKKVFLLNEIEKGQILCKSFVDESDFFSQTSEMR